MEEKEKKPPHWTLEKIKELKEGYEALAFGFPPEYLQDVKGIIELIQQAKEEEERKKEKEKH